MTDNDLLKLDNQLCHRFYIVSNALTRAYRPLLKTLDVTYPQYLVLLALWEHQQLTISELVGKCCIDAGAMTLILKKLTEKDLVKVFTDEQDKRIKRVALTVNGQQAKRSAAAIPKQMACHIKHLEASEIQQLSALIDRLYGDLTAQPDTVTD